MTTATAVKKPTHKEMENILVQAARKKEGLSFKFDKVGGIHIRPQYDTIDPSLTIHVFERNDFLHIAAGKKEYKPCSKSSEAKLIQWFELAQAGEITESPQLCFDRN